MVTTTPTTAVAGGGDDEPASLIPPIVLGCIFGIFVVILGASLYCFCLRKKRCRLNTANRKPHDTAAGVSGQLHEEPTKRDTSKVLELTNRDSVCTSVRGVPDYVSRGSEKRKHDDNNDETFNFMVANDKQKLLERCATLDRRGGSRKEKESSGSDAMLFKSLSSPCVMGEEAGSDFGPVDTTALLQDCNITELQDVVSDLDSSHVPLANSLFKDSYDPFCHSEPGDASFREFQGGGAAAREAKIEHPLELYSIEHSPIKSDRRRRGSSTSRDVEPIPKDEPDCIASYRKDSSNSKDADVSSSGTVEGAAIKNNDTNNDANNDTNIDTNNDTHDVKSQDSKSSGYSEGNGSSDNLENLGPVSPQFVPLPPGRGDVGYHSNGYHSDASSQQLSPLDFRSNNKFTAQPLQQQRDRFASVGHNVQVFSHEEAARVMHSSPCRPKQPPSYTQAVVDIERMSERSDKTTESEFDYLVEMERQLGVRISDTDDNNVNPWTQRRYRHSVPRNYFSDSGATTPHSDTYVNPEVSPSLSQQEKWNNRLTEQEKTQRCNQLLEEFKTSRKNQEGGGSSLLRGGGSPSHVLGQREGLCSPSQLDFKVMGDVIPEETTRRRRGSSSSTVNEWLV